jgi:hypothetical protein
MVNRVVWTTQYLSITRPFRTASSLRRPDLGDSVHYLQCQAPDLWDPSSVPFRRCRSTHLPSYARTPRLWERLAEFNEDGPHRRCNMRITSRPITFLTKRNPVFEAGLHTPAACHER